VQVAVEPESDPDAAPGDRVRAACLRVGEAEFVRRCAAVLADPSAHGALLPLLGDVPAYAFLPSGEPSYWVPVWATRALLYAWDPSASPAVVTGLRHENWRVREMSAKVCAKREIGEAGDVLATLATDPIPRVRAAAARALGLVGESEHADALRLLRDDAESSVRVAADRALRVLSRRLDRDLSY